MSETLERTELAVLPKSALPTVLAADKDDLLGKLQDRLRSLKLDASTPKGRDEIRSAAAEVARVKSALLKLADGVSEEARKTHKAIVAEKHVIEEKLDALKDQVRAPLTEYENIEKARVEGHERAIAQIDALANIPADATAEDIAGLIDAFAQSDLMHRDWKEFEPRARKAETNTRNALKAAYADAVAAEAEAKRQAEERAAEAERECVEAARLQAEREARIAAEAAQRAREEAEARAAREAADKAAAVERERQAAAKREQDAKDAAERAQREAAAAEQRRIEAEAKAEADRIAAEERAARESKEAAQRAEREKAAAVEAEKRRAAQVAAAEKAEADRRAADKAHRGKINRAAANALMVAARITEENAIAIVTAMARGEIPAVRIAY